MAHGTVKFFNAAKGFGFITSDDDGKDIFVPASTLTSAGMKSLTAGQRVLYEARPDVKGPKAVALKIVAEFPAPKIQALTNAPPHRVPPASKLKVYLDADSDAADEVLEEVRRSCRDCYVVDYVTSVLTKEELQRLSLLLRDSDQSLVRKYDPLFLELRLDDRFIGDTEFWGAIVEHPALINGPILATATRASICRSASAVKAFLGSLTSADPKAAAKPKGLPESLRRLLSGNAELPPASAEKIIADIGWRPPEKPEEKAEAKPKAVSPESAKPAPSSKAPRKAPVKARVAAKSKTKSATKSKKASGKVPPKPTKKARRTGRR